MGVGDRFMKELGKRKKSGVQVGNKAGREKGGKADCSRTSEGKNRIAAKQEASNSSKSLQ